MNLNIRRLANTAEAQSCARLMASSEPWITLRRDYVASLSSITAAEKEVYVAVIDDEVAGFAVLNLHGAFVGYVQSMCVAERWRNLGMGRQILSFVEQRIFAETPNLFICVSSFNAGARRLYEGLGYELVGALKDYIVPGHSELLFRKSISPLTEFSGNH